MKKLLSLGLTCALLCQPLLGLADDATFIPTGRTSEEDDAACRTEGNLPAGVLPVGSQLYNYRRCLNLRRIAREKAALQEIADKKLIETKEKGHEDAVRRQEGLEKQTLRTLKSGQSALRKKKAKKDLAAAHQTLRNERTRLREEMTRLENEHEKAFADKQNGLRSDVCASLKVAKERQACTIEQTKLKHSTGSGSTAQ